MSAEDADGSTSLLTSARTYLSRKLAPGVQTFVQGGGNQRKGYFEKHEREPERLEEYERIYERGGPVTSLVDTRALMSFGTGAEFNVKEEGMSAVVDGSLVTPEEWLEDAFRNLDNLLVAIGKDAYVYGDALGELVETRGGNFSHVELVNPKTMKAFWDDHGRIHLWTQSIKTGAGEERTISVPDEEIAHFKLHSIGRSPLGLSLIGQNYDEIQRFARNQEAIENAIRLHGFPKYHIKVGREGAGTVPDQDLRNVRQRFRKFNEKTNWTTGRDIEIETLDTAGFEVNGLAEHDLMILAAGFQVPEEMAGLGRGSTEATAKVRLQAFERNARAEQRQLADQFVEQVVRPVLDRYSPFPRDLDVELAFGDVVSDQTATAEWLGQFEDYYSVNEVREKLGDSPLEGEELEAAQERRGEGEDPFGGLFGGFGGGGGMDQTAEASATPDDATARPEEPDPGGDPRMNRAIPAWMLRGEVRRDGGE